MIGMKYLFLEQRAPAGAVENEVTFAFQGARTGMGSWLADAGSGRCGGVSPGRCAGRRLRVDARALAAVRGVHRADHQVGAGLRTRPGEPGREARRRFRSEPDRCVGDRSGPGADGPLCQRPDVGHGGRGKQSDGHRQLASKAGGSVQRGAWTRRAEQAHRVSAGELRADGPGARSNQEDFRSPSRGPTMGAISWRPQIAAMRSVPSRPGAAARRSCGPRSSSASFPRLQGSTRPRSRWLNAKGALESCRR